MTRKKISLQFSPFTFLQDSILYQGKQNAEKKKEGKLENLLEINGEIDEVIGGQRLVIPFSNLFIAVNAVVVQHIQ